MIICDECGAPVNEAVGFEIKSIDHRFHACPDHYRAFAEMTRPIREQYVLGMLKAEQDCFPKAIERRTVVKRGPDDVGPIPIPPDLGR
jgi:hypothetical protein